MMVKSGLQSYAQKVLLKQRPFSLERRVQASFDSVTRYLPDCKALLQRDRARQVQSLNQNLQKGDWTKIMSDYAKLEDDLAIDGLKAFHDKLIFQEQFATTVFCSSLMKEFTKVQTLSLFTAQGKINGEAAGFIGQTLQAKANMQFRMGNFLEGDKLGIFWNQMRKQPASEQCFFMVEGQYSSSCKTVTDAINDIGMNVFGYFRDQNNYPLRMVPSLSMMQQFLIAQTGNDAVTITPVLGTSSREDIHKNAVTDTRDMALPFPGIVLPKTADDEAAPKSLHFWDHDLYHAFVASKIPRNFRHAFATCADSVLELKKEYTDLFIIQILDDLYQHLIDMEHANFWSLTSQKPAIIFFSSFAEKIKAVLARPSKQAIDLEVHHALLREHRVVEKLAINLFQKNFCEKYDISRQDLQDVMQKKMGVVDFSIWTAWEAKVEYHFSELRRENWIKSGKTCLATQLFTLYQKK
jgi:hypothetical protein